MRKINRIFGFLVLITGVFFVPYTLAAETNDNPRPEFGGQWIWALFSLVIVVFLAYWATRFMAGKFNISQTRHIKVAESLCLGPNRHLYLLLLNNQVLLVGSTEQGISLLKEYTDEALFEELKVAQESTAPLQTEKFKSVLMGLLKHEDLSATGNINFAETKQKLLEGLEHIRNWRKRR